MPITINLLEEEQRRAVARLHDPLKVVMRVGFCGIGALILVNGVLTFLTGRARQEWKHYEAEWTAPSVTVPDEKGNPVKVSLQDRRAALDELAKKRISVHNELLSFSRFSSRRLLWGSQLETLRTLLPPRVYLTEISGSSKFERVPRPATAPAAAPPPTATSPEGTEPPPAPPTDQDAWTTEIILRGRVRCDRDYEAAQTVESFVARLRGDETFSKLFANPARDIVPEQIGSPTDFTEMGKRPVKEAPFTIKCKLRPVIVD
jgi:Tfp pilus assembly protein PilN